MICSFITNLPSWKTLASDTAAARSSPLMIDPVGYDPNYKIK